MAQSHDSSNSSSELGEDKVYPHTIASSLANLPKPGGEEDGAAKTKSDFLDLADGTTRFAGTAPADITSRLELKRVEHERQRALQKAAFEEQMKQLELQQEREERELERGIAPSDAASATDGSTATAATRSRSGNDLGFNGVEGGDRKRSDYANAKSMPGSPRRAVEVVEGADGERRVKGRDGEAPMMNSFLFDDELEADLQNSAWGGKYLQMNTDDDKFPILIRRDSYPGILSASSAALDLAPLPQTTAARGFRTNDGRAGASEWPQFQAQARPAGEVVDAASVERQRTVTSIEEQADRASPRPRGTGAGTLPPPRSSMGGVGQTASGRSSPSVEKKADGTIGTAKTGMAAGLSSSGSGFVDTITDQFSNFNIDSNAFAPDSNQGPFGGYGGHDGAFAYDGTGGAYGMGGKSTLYGIDDPVQQSETNRFAGLRLEDLQGDMLPLCKDQFGCRYLQKKLEDGNPEHRDMIFNEIFPHFGELMTDPFANYLSQRLLEYSTDEQRDALIESISGELVSISLNMHGTRAVQKMIDYLSTQRQVQSLILALNLNVVTLIKDLNGNHVIQKCLNHLPPEDNQFIYNAVATHCIEVATHRHGCCVLQRCIDHASESQRIQLVTEITYNSLTLVQDAFGNYVVQYVLDLNDNRFIEAIVRQFLGNVSALSAQKFSSNVVEKCIRVADATGRRAIIDELLNKQRLERLLRDSFANYVVQTALDYAEPAQRAQLIETIRPILPMIRNTPYGKRIQSKIQRETSDHMSRTAYHPALIPGGYNGHFMNPQQFLQHPGQMGMNPMGMSMNQMGGDFGRGGSPYMTGNVQHMGMQQQHHQQQQNGGMQNGGMQNQGQQQFQPFQQQQQGQQQQQQQQQQQDYQQSNNGYAPFM